MDDMPLTKKGKSAAQLPFMVSRNDGGRTRRTTFFEFNNRQSIDLT